MKKTMLSLILALAIVLSVCAPMALAGDLNKDAELKLWIPTQNPYPTGATENDNPFINAIREHTGYKNIVIELITDGSNQMNLLMAGGEYPDAIYVNGNRPFFLQYLTEGLWAPVDEAVATYGPAMGELMNEASWAAGMGEDGQHYAVYMPLHTSYKGEYFGNSFMYNADILNELNLEVPNTVDELEAVLLAVKAAYPDIIPLSLVGADNGMLKAAFGMWTQYTIDENGKLVNTYRQNFKDYVTYMNKLYNEGLLDPEMLYQTGTEKTEKVVNGKVFMIDDTVWCKTYRQTIVANGGTFNWDYTPSFENNDGTVGQANPFPASQIWMFPVTSNNLNECIDMINTFVSDKELEMFVNYGEEGVHYTFDDNGAIVAINDQGQYDSIMYKIDYRFWFKPDVWLNNAILGDYMPEIEKFVAAVDMTNENLWNYMPTSQASIDYQSPCNDIMNEYRDKIIIGELPVDAVDEMFARMDAAGYTEIEAAAQEWYDATGAGLAESLGLLK